MGSTIFMPTPHTPPRPSPINLCHCSSAVEDENLHTSILSMCLSALHSPNTLPTVKLWKLCVDSYFFAVSLSLSILSAPTRHALFRFRSRSSSSFAGSLSLSEDCAVQKVYAEGLGEDDLCAKKVLWSSEPGFGGMRRYEGKK